MLTFATKSRARTLPTGSKARNYKSADGRYLVIEISGACGRYWLAARQLATGQSYLGRYSNRRAAEQACLAHRSS